ncbi:MAG: chemotaxis protein CheC [Bacteroidota bacterium]
MDTYKPLSAIQLDALSEIGNIGAGHAATVLSQLLRERISITVPRINIVPLASASEMVGGPETVVVGIYLRVFGDAPSSILFIFPRQAAMQLVDILVGRKPGSTNLLREYEQSALKEIGNILTGAFLYALSNFTGLAMLPSVPAYAMDMAGAILGTVLLEMGTVSDYALVIETSFITKDQDSRGHFFLLPDLGTLDVLLNAIGVGSGCQR